jgi:hypothetical protein
MRIRRICSLLLLPLLVACSTNGPAQEAESEAIRASVREISGFVRDGWHLPFRARVFLADGTAAEERLALDQLEEIKQAYVHTAFDFYAADVVIEAGDSKDVRLDPESLHLEVRLGSATDDPISASDLLTEIAKAYRWKRAELWYAGERTEDLVAALRRDLGKLSRLEGEIALGCKRLELLTGTLRARSEEGKEAVLCPSEADYARSAQFRATFALNRVLNTLARWRLASTDPQLSVQREALTVAHYARLLHEVYLDWLLKIVVGGRTRLKIWSEDWRHRNPLYKALDAEAPILAIEGKQVPARVPEGAIRALLGLRLDDDLRDCYESFDRLWVNRTPLSPTTPLAGELNTARSRMQAIRKLGEDKELSGFTAWKELWDARFKDKVSLPFYGLIASIARFLGDTRTSHPPPAVTSAQLADLAAELQPGDVILVRQDRYLSNAFLPGFWSHALLYLGPIEDWGPLALSDGTPLLEDPVVRSVLEEYGQHIDGKPARVIEAISEGVVFNSLEHAVQKDYIAVLRPELSKVAIAEGIRRALRFVGRPYDFDFDFATDDKIVCTELVYRAYDPELNFAECQRRGASIPGVLEVMGRLAMPANELARLTLYMNAHPDPEPRVGYPGNRLRLVKLLDRPQKRGPAEVLSGRAALTRLQRSVSR